MSKEYTDIVYDTEFIERGPHHPIDLISLGMVRSDGKQYYAVSNAFDASRVKHHPWLSVNVWPHLPLNDQGVLDRKNPIIKSRQQIAFDVREFVLELPNPRLWAAWSAYDHVVLCQLFGSMVDLPPGFPMHTKDIKSLSEDLGDPPWPKQLSAEHHALTDAQYGKEVLDFLKTSPFIE
jgi:hypothetical protein